MSHKIFSAWSVTLLAAGIIVAMNMPAVAQQYKILHNFNCTGSGGCAPAAGLVFDSAGNLFGTTSYGGLNNGGSVFELSPQTGGGWAEKTLYDFNQSAKDAYGPQSTLIVDAAHNLYGTTPLGGEYDEGTVFEVSPKAGGGWSEKVILAFGSSNTQGYSPYGGVIADASGNLYGTTAFGTQFGTVFELSPSATGNWMWTLVHSFEDDGQTIDGLYPYAGLIADSAGNLYGTTFDGGAASNCWDSAGFFCGTAFELSPVEGGGWTETILYSFTGGFDGVPDGNHPYANLAFDAAGNLYGTTEYGGDEAVCQTTAFLGCGTIFKLTHGAGGKWTEKILHSFGENQYDAVKPVEGLVVDKAGNIYGTTPSTGTQAPYGNGIVFELSPKPQGIWSEKVLHNFGSQSKLGSTPYTNLIFDAAGNLYGTAAAGGAYGGGVVFEITP
jgi:uncharacterized repeat protein (TIGR03803 family)